MRLRAEQKEQFDRDGYLFFPSLFTPDETRTLTDAVPELYEWREEYNVCEKGPTLCAPTSRRTCIGHPSRGTGEIRAGSSLRRICSVKSSTCTSSKSTARWRLRATCGNGDGTTAPRKTTISCRPNAR